MNSYAALRPLLDGQRMLAPMFYLGYMVSELRRRKGRTLLTALGLGVGVGLVVTVSALSKGLDNAQEKVLEPLTGVGTDMSVTAPAEVRDSGNGLPAGSRPSERDQLQQARTAPRRFDLANQAKPGEKFTRHRLHVRRAAQLPGLARSPRSPQLDGVEGAAGSLTLNAVTIKGTVPKNGFQRPRRPGPQPQGGRRQRAPFDVDSLSVTGVDESKPRSPRSPGPDHEGPLPRRLRPRGRAQRVLRPPQQPRASATRSRSAARQFTVVGLAQLAARRPGLGRLREARPAAEAQRPRGPREHPPGARRQSTDDVAAVEKAIKATFDRRVGDDRRRPRRPRRRLARRRQGPVRQARHGADDRRAGGGVPDRHAADALLGHQAHPRARHAQGARLAAAATVVRQVTGESVLQGALGGVARRADRDRRRRARERARRRRSRRPCAGAGAAGRPAGPGGPGSAASSASARRAVTSGTEKIAARRARRPRPDRARDRRSRCSAA